tara:strand:- start:2647 stop:4062 length:1416 start_codon:yes stop_codon:yes gene_type:complete
MINWGIAAYNHDGAIASVQHDKILFAGHAERYSGVKNDKDLNEGIILDALSYGEPDVIHWYEQPILKNFRRLHAGQKWKKENFRKKLKKLGVDKPIKYHFHHETHAAAGFYTSGYESAAVLVIDAIGEFDTASIWHATPKGLKKVWSLKYPSSLGLFYSAITHRCGLKPNEEEYILMGMAAYGDPDRYYKSMSLLLDENLHRGCRWWEYGKEDYFDFAASAQKIYEEEFDLLVQKAKELLPEEYKLVLMGGCALNCVANNIAIKHYDNIWIMPNPGDAGSSLGAILAGSKKHVNWEGPYLGKNIVGNWDHKHMIDYLLDQKMIGVAKGRAEFGPRAFGNRSLLADPRGPDIKDKVNAIKRRQEFRPFAPVILQEHAREYFNMPLDAAPYMQYVVQCTSQEVPAITHADGTSRVQTVTLEQHPDLYKLLRLWYERTGCPLLLNTSLNIKGKPMVNTWQDALEFEKKYQVKVF